MELVWKEDEGDEFKVAEMNVMKLAKNGREFAVAGEKKNLAVWDFEARKALFKAAAELPDKLNIVPPVCINTLCYITPDTILIGTNYHEVCF